jgi:hypothetical protein
MPLTITGFAAKDRSSEEISKTLHELDPKKVHYKLEYFDVSAVGGLPRDILAYGKADWEDLILTVTTSFYSTFFSHFSLSFFSRFFFRLQLLRTGLQRSKHRSAISQSCTSTQRGLKAR